MSMWRNWYTHITQNDAGNHVGSSPTIDTITQIPFEDGELLSSFSFFLSVSLKVSSKTLAEIFLELLSK